MAQKCGHEIYDMLRELYFFGSCNPTYSAKEWNDKGSADQIFMLFQRPFRQRDVHCAGDRKFPFRTFLSVVAKKTYFKFTSKTAASSVQDGGTHEINFGIESNLTWPNIVEVKKAL